MLDGSNWLPYVPSALTVREPRVVTVKVMPPGDGAGGSIKTFRIPRWRISVGRWSPFVAVGLVGLLGAQGWALWQHDRDNAALRSENVQLRSQIEAVDEEVASLSRTIGRVQQFDARLRQMTSLSDPSRNLAMGPVGDPKPAPEAPVAARTADGLERDLLGAEGSDRALELIRDRVEVLSEDASEVDGSVRSLEVYLEDQQALLSATPSLMPTRGWQTSEFGFRTDPYTGLRQMHSGLDIAAAHGKEVIAPGDGVVTHAGPQGAYGNVVIVEHGHGLSTLYAHLSEILVKVGDEPKRGATLGRVGNTGRSTGPHLHYEVRLNGVPQNPERFILE